MKFVKQPFFIIGAGAMFVAIVIAILSSVLNPSSALINKYEKAWNEEDEDLLEECFSSELDDEEIALAALEIASMEGILALIEADEDDVEYQILLGDETEDVITSETEDGETEEIAVKRIPTIVVIREDGEVIYVYSSERVIMEVDGDECFYTGFEDQESGGKD